MNAGDSSRWPRTQPIIGMSSEVGPERGATGRGSLGHARQSTRLRDSALVAGPVRDRVPAHSGKESVGMSTRRLQREPDSSLFGVGLRAADHPYPRRVSPVPQGRPLKYTLCVTQQCNLSCTYCYVRKSDTTMSRETAAKTLDFVFRHAQKAGSVEIGFFGGEPLLAFDVVRSITEMIEGHPGYQPERVKLSITTNGTIFDDAIAAFLCEHDFKVCVSCDGPSEVHDTFRRTREGEGCSATLERNLRSAVRTLPALLVNAVFHPRTFRRLPDTVDYLSGLGLRRIYLNPDFSAPWTAADAADLPEIYAAIGERYTRWYQQGDPHFISLLDTKIATLLRGGYQADERCQMGKGEMAFTCDGGIYPCERLIGDGVSGSHRIGDVEHGIDPAKLACGYASGAELNAECLDCGLKSYCMNWCGCSNVFMTGQYNRVGPFLCASEKAAIATARNVFATLEKEMGPVFLHHFSGSPQVNSRVSPQYRQQGHTGQTTHPQSGQTE